MSILSSVVHAAGNVAAPLSEAAGAVGSVGGLVPNSFASQATALGHNISNPNVTLSNPGGILASNDTAFAGAGAYGSPVPQITSPSTSTAPKNYTSTNPTSTTSYDPTTGYSTSTGTYNPSLAQALSDQYNTQIGALQGNIDLLNNVYGTQTNDLNNSYLNQGNALAQQHASGMAHLQQQQQVLDQSRSNSLRDLVNSLRGSVNGYNNMIGNYGAGSSSAVPLISYALTQQANRNRGDILQQAADSQTGLNQANSDLESGFANQKQALDLWKQQQLNSLASAYAANIKNYQDQIQNARGYQAYQEALYNLPGAQDALNSLKALDAQYSDHLANLKSAYQPHSIDGSFANQAAQYSAAPVSASQLQGLSLANNQAQYDNPNIPVYLKRPGDANIPSY